MRRSAEVLILLVAAIGSACSGDAKSVLAKAVTDTLPGGIRRVMSPGPTAWTDTNGWKLVAELRIEGSEGDSAILSDPISLALDDDGRVYVADVRPAMVKVFDRTGRLIRTIGRDGSGPGEFTFPLLAIYGSTLLVHDPRQSRISVFDTSGSFVRSWTTVCCEPEPITVDNEGLVYINGSSPPDSGRMIVRYTLEGIIRDTVLLPRDQKREQWELVTIKGPMPVSVPLAPRLLQRSNPEGGFLMGMTGHYIITASRTGRDTLMLFGRDWSANSVSLSRRQAAADSVIEIVSEVVGEAVARREINAGDVPATAPAFGDIAVDGRGYRWIMVDPGDDAGHTWFDVFDSAGVYLGQVAGPPSLTRRRMAWNNDAMAAYEVDDSGIPVVIKYAIRRTP
jgi:hypothetical protein